VDGVDDHGSGVCQEWQERKAEEALHGCKNERQLRVPDGKEIKRDVGVYRR
jgi:hypothetical protein